MYGSFLFGRNAPAQAVAVALGLLLLPSALVRGFVSPTWPMLGDYSGYQEHMCKNVLTQVSTGLVPGNRTPPCSACKLLANREEREPRRAFSRGPGARQ